MAAPTRWRAVLAPLALGGCLAAGAEQSECAPVPGAERLLARGTVVLLGEMHGTEESPAFALQLACRVVTAELPLRFGIELEESERPRVQAFLDATDDAEARRALLEGAPWKAESQYGLTSAAMLRLFAGLRALRRSGHDVSIVLFNRSGEGGSQARDRRMAEFLAAQANQFPDAVFVVLTGNVHSRIQVGTPWDPAFEPMGYLLSKMRDAGRVLGLDVAHADGTAWICQGSTAPDCGVRPLKGRGPAGAGITWTDTPTPTGHNGWYHVGPLHASPPALEVR